MQTNPIHTVDARIDDIYAVCEGRIDWNNMVPTVIAVATEVEQLKNMKGPEKLEIVQKVIRLAMKKSDLSAEKKEMILHYVDTIVPIIAQAAIWASKNPIAQEVKAVCIGCWTRK